MRFVRRSEEFEVHGHGRFAYDGGGELGGPLDTIGPASISSLREAIRAAADYYGGGELKERIPIWLTETSPEDFDEDYSPRAQVSFEVGPREFLVSVVTFLTESSLTEADVERIVSPLLKRRGCRLREVDCEGAEPNVYWWVRFAPPTRGRTLADVYEQGRDVLALLEAVEGAGLSPSTVADLIRGGKADVLVGSPESSWLEAKSQGYELRSERAKIELGKDVARFANAEFGGLLVIGLRASKRPQGELIRAVTPVRMESLNVRQYRANIDRRVYPPVQGLEVESVETDPGKGLLFVHVPPQPEELKPFLVHGAIVAGRAEESFISIVRRRGEDSIPATPAAIHSMLAAGRALLRGQGPERPPTVDPR